MSGPDIPNALDQCFFRMLAKNLKDRYQDMGDVIRDLRACSRILKGLNDDTADTTVFRETPEELDGNARRPNRRLIAVSGGLLLAMALSAWAVKRFVIDSAGSRHDDEDSPPVPDDAAPSVLIPLEAFPADLLKIVREDRDVVAGSEWKFGETRILTGIGKAARFQIPVGIPKEYALTLRVTRREGAGPLIVGLATGQDQCYILLDRDGSSGIGVDRLNQLVENSSEISLPIGEPVVIRCLLADSRVEVFVNEEKLLFPHWRSFRASGSRRVSRSSKRRFLCRHEPPQKRDAHAI